MLPLELEVDTPENKLCINTRIRIHVSNKKYFPPNLGGGDTNDRENSLPFFILF